LEGTDMFPLSENINSRFIIADFYKNTIMIDVPNIEPGKDTARIYINTKEIVILKANLLNFQFLFIGQYLEYVINPVGPTTIFQRKLFKITGITTQLVDINAPNTVENTRLHIEGIWTLGLPLNYNNSPAFYDGANTIRLNHFNFGVRDLFDEKIFYLNLYPFVPSKEVSTDPTFNNTFGVLYPATPNSTKDYLYLRGDAVESYTNVNLQTTANKIQFSLMDSNNQLIGTVYNKYFTLYKPDNISLTSYFSFMPDLNIILKIEEVDKKFKNIG